MNQTSENGKKPNFGPEFGLFGLNLSPYFFSIFFFLLRVLPLLVVRHCSKLYPTQFKGKLINQTWENIKKPNFRPDFDPFWPKFDLPKKNFVGFTSTGCYTLYAISRKTNKPSLRKWQKT